MGLRLDKHIHNIDLETRSSALARRVDDGLDRGAIDVIGLRSGAMYRRLSGPSESSGGVYHEVPRRGEPRAVDACGLAYLCYPDKTAIMTLAAARPLQNTPLRWP